MSDHALLVAIAVAVWVVAAETLLLVLLAALRWIRVVRTALADARRPDR